jgi:hypothetical protein
MMNGKTYIIRKHKGEKLNIVATNIKNYLVIHIGVRVREYDTWRVGWSGI